MSFGRSSGDPLVTVVVIVLFGGIMLLAWLVKLVFLLLRSIVLGYRNHLRDGGVVGTVLWTILITAVGVVFVGGAALDANPALPFGSVALLIGTVPLLAFIVEMCGRSARRRSHRTRHALEDVDTYLDWSNWTTANEKPKKRHLRANSEERDDWS